ncbi:phage tail protein [Lacticaseibacillus chiayiensis]|uniref:Phage tail protein n=1 Tax=Lacticaseibacillus chiayiensis TaxID=2100821 RepID=A0A4Q1TI26_9LACO|nr:distal tail protein Dit [Lacticaseibacillus chiayiensis]RXT17733.1 phage tail protein [Lacticaseibacillus chiayiensis]
MANLIFGDHKIGSSSLQFSAARGVFSEVENTTQSVGASDGEMLVRSHLKSRIIPVTYDFVALSRREFERQLAPLLYSTDVQKLIIDDRPDEFWYAKVDGKIDMDRAYFLGTGTINFLVPDGIAHSVATKTFDNMPYKDLSNNLLHNTGDDWNPVIWSTDGTTTTHDGITTATNTSKSVIQTVVDPNDSSWLTSGATVTISVDVKGQGNIGFGYFTGSGWEDDSPTQQVDSDEYIRLYFTRTINSVHFDAGNPNFAVDAFCPTSTLTFRHVKLEIGTSASPWSPNPADAAYYTDTITVKNSGTVPVPVKVTSQFSSDDGFLGLTLNGRYYQVGNTKEVNGKTYDDSQMLVKTRPTIDKYILNDPSFAVIPADQGVMTQTGTVTINPDSTTYLGITTPSDFGPNNYGPHGPSLIYKLPADSNGEVGAVNCILRMHAGLGALSLDSPSDTRQVGQICMTIYDKDKKALARILYSDMSQTTSDFNVRFDLNEKKVREEDFANSPGFTGHCYIRKTGSQFIFAWGGEAGGTAQTYTCEEFADTKVMYVSFSFLQWADLPLPHYFGLIEWNFEKDYVDLYKDLPNYFKAGDVVTLDSSTNLLKINQYTDWDRVDIGSQPLLAPPGQSTLGIVVSPWANLPAVSTELREGWL